MFLCCLIMVHSSIWDLDCTFLKVALLDHMKFQVQHVLLKILIIGYAMLHKVKFCELRSDSVIFSSFFR